MTTVRPMPRLPPTKAPTGIVGFDEITGASLPRSRTALVLGGPGSGKTVFALQFLVHGAQRCKESGIFVAFVDVLREPKRALADGIFMTPTLLKLAPAPAPVQTIVGSLSQTEPLLQALGLEMSSA